MNVTEGRLELIVAWCLIALGASTFWGAMLMPFGSPSLPGPGFFPRFLSLGLMGAGVAIAVRRSLLDRSGDPDGKASVSLGHRHIAVAFFATCVAAALFEPAGFLITSALYLVVLLRTLAPLGWIGSAVAAIAGAIAAHLFFIELLRVPLPGGPFNL